MDDIKKVIIYSIIPFTCTIIVFAIARYFNIPHLSDVNSLNGIAGFFTALSVLFLIVTGRVAL